MLNDILFVQQSLTANLFYLRNLSQFCFIIEQSFLAKDKEYINTIQDFKKRTTNLFKQTFLLSDGKILKDVLSNQILVTKYTYELEVLTEKLFGRKIDTDLTLKQLELQANETFQVSDTLLEEVQKINQEALILSANFIDFCSSVYKQLTNNLLFSFSYPALFLYMIEEMALYYTDLQRLINRTDVDPILIADFEFYFSNSLRNASNFIAGFSDTNQFIVIQQAQKFSKDFAELMKKVQGEGLNPIDQEQFRQDALLIVKDYKEFLESLINDLLSSKKYFIVPPIFFDTLLTEANFFYYLLSRVVSTK